MDNTKIVGEKIKALREAKQISVDDLVERTGLAYEQIERIAKKQALNTGTNADANRHRPK